MRPRLVNCPICSKRAEYSETNPFRPFCSERCKTQDIAAWASEGYRVPSNEPLTEAELEEVIGEGNNH
jgi:endogenous inhibitor of DNA gyrase (YacG/DUF329 family)